MTNALKHPITPIGPWKTRTGFAFRAWAPKARSLHLEMASGAGERLPMSREGNGFWHLEVAGAAHGDTYLLAPGKKPGLPDPASHHQPMGVPGPSALVDHGRFAWSAPAFVPPPPDGWVIYELHMGTFTPQGTFDAAIARIPHIQDLGATAVEVMPLAQFPGGRNWGYDGVLPFAVQHSYGGPEGFKRFVDACHTAGLAVVLDAVYNHLGPEENRLADFGPYFTDRYSTPWGKALNFDGPHSDGVHNFVLANARHWMEHYRVDGLRLDAVDSIFDARPRPILRNLGDLAHDLARSRKAKPLMVAESDRNDPRLALPPAKGGMGLDAVWSDDFHHAVHALLTGERGGYYADFGDMDDVVEAVKSAFVRPNGYRVYRKRAHGEDAEALPGAAHVVYLQNHDQVGNRAQGERLASLVPFEAAKAAAALLLTAPFTPLIFMGEEYLETNPFHYFVSHNSQALRKAVRKGRERDARAFKWKASPPDPADPATFAASRLDWAKTGQGDHQAMLALYKALIALRRNTPCLATLDKSRCLAKRLGQALAMYLVRYNASQSVLALFNFTPEPLPVAPNTLPPGCWQRILLSTAETRFAGPGFPTTQSFHPQRPLPPLSATLFLGGRG